MRDGFYGFSVISARRCRHDDAAIFTLPLHYYAIAYARLLRRHYDYAY